ncbi:hypothetical protein V6N13_050184 [Hibiscus sabdariffa]
MSERIFTCNTFCVHRETFLEYCREVEKLAFRLLELISISLGLPGNRFSDLFKQQTGVLKLNYYPPCPSPLEELVNEQNPIQQSIKNITGGSTKLVVPAAITRNSMLKTFKFIISRCHHLSNLLLYRLLLVSASNFIDWCPFMIDLEGFFMLSGITFVQDRMNK